MFRTAILSGLGDQYTSGYTYHVFVFVKDDQILLAVSHASPAFILQFYSEYMHSSLTKMTAETVQIILFTVSHDIDRPVQSVIVACHILSEVTHLHHAKPVAMIPCIKQVLSLSGHIAAVKYVFLVRYLYVVTHAAHIPIQYVFLPNAKTLSY